LATSNQTPNFGLSQYAANDPVKFLTNYNEDMVKIDQSSVPNTRKIAGINLQDDILLSELVAAGLAEGTGGAANNALALGGVGAGNYPQVSSGTWTPALYGSTVAGNPTYTTTLGRYYKVGRYVYVDGAIGIVSKGGMQGDLALNGLPYAVNSAVYGLNGFNFTPFGGLIPDKQLFGIAEGTGIALWYGPPGTILRDTDIVDGFNIWSFSGQYLTI